MANPMGEAKLEPLRVDCDRNLEFSLARCSSAACQFLFDDLSILTVPSRHADAYDLASFRMR